ncbi:hypothetical protein BG53_00770 [Paenibacillus darwinianus]|uniref:Uncharacterized protein n=1 Tax=Paenibacillus darwinianus TaxID=1380763 RepID=A0A9W5S3W2_9BACL|nr:hypothetical protein [Paenibacillus darwinianus]EXX91461.1 hypothetical protein BG52_10240 [Paenibacillus darwinianus]EXX92258.1 hypothetical protein BG53_00770 [Paenibacillus darwinianus]EXX92268.1 hypothetical protein CH50_11645 [Paenibacillus darwinianus]
MSDFTQEETMKPRNRSAWQDKTAQAVQGRKDKPRLPPRSTKHPSNKQQMAKWFYHTLIFLFLVLAAGLFLFGRQLAGNP